MFTRLRTFVSAKAVVYGPKIDAAQAYCLSIANMWWRPISCWSIAIAIAVSGVYLPLHNKTATDLGSLAALVASLTPFVAARTYEKMKSGIDENT